VCSGGLVRTVQGAGVGNTRHPQGWIRPACSHQLVLLEREAAEVLDDFMDLHIEPRLEQGLRAVLRPELFVPLPGLQLAFEDERPDLVEDAPAAALRVKFRDQIDRAIPQGLLINRVILHTVEPRTKGGLGRTTMADRLSMAWVGSCPQAQRLWRLARWPHGGWQSGGGSSQRDSRSSSLERMVGRFGDFRCGVEVVEDTTANS